MTVESDWKARTNPWLREIPEQTSLIEIKADPYQDTQDACDYLTAIESLDDAEGEHLDIMGSWIGVRRPMLQEEDDNLCTFFFLGETCDPDGSQGMSHSDYPDDGGYMAHTAGLASVTNPGAMMLDADYRKLIKAKGKTFFLRATPVNIFNFLLTFGARCKINEDTDLRILIEPVNFDDLNDWERWYASHKGFKPGGIAVDCTTRLVHAEEI